MKGRNTETTRDPRAGGFFGLRRVMVVGGGAEIVAPAIREAWELMRLSSRTGCHSLLWLMGLRNGQGVNQ